MYELKASLKRQQKHGFKAILHISVLAIQHVRLRASKSKVFNTIPPRAVGHDKTWNSTLRDFWIFLYRRSYIIRYYFIMYIQSTEYWSKLRVTNITYRHSDNLNDNISVLKKLSHPTSRLMWIIYFKYPFYAEFYKSRHQEISWVAFMVFHRLEVIHIVEFLTIFFFREKSNKNMKKK